MPVENQSLQQASEKPSSRAFDLLWDSAKTFNAYADLHGQKGTEDGDKKSLVNQEKASEILEFLESDDSLSLSRRLKAASEIGQWLGSGHSGLSSTLMASVALGAKNIDRSNYPHDRGDFGRCYNLLQIAPTVRDYFDDIAKVSPQWSALIENWAELESIFLSNDYSGLSTRIVMLAQPEHYAEEQTRKLERIEREEKALKAKAKAPTHSPLGMLFAPDPSKDKELEKSLLQVAATALCVDLVAHGYIALNDIDSVIEELVSNPFLANASGGEVFKQLGFDVADGESSSIIDTLSEYSGYFNDALNSVLAKWVKDNNIKPSLSIGQKVTFKHGREQKTGIIDSIETTRYSPMHYLIDIGAPGKPVIQWDDVSLSIVPS